MTSRAVYMHEGGKVEVKEVPLPTIEPGAVLLKTLVSEVCGTDCHLRKGHLSGVPYPIIPGHVSVGAIHDKNGKITDVDGIELVVGDHVTFLDVHETCNNCWFCLVAKTSTRCPKRKVYGVTYSANDGLLGGWSQYLYLKPGVKILKLPPNLPPKIFMSGGCGLPTALHAVQRANIQLGDNVVIQGSGPVGLMAAVLAKTLGAFNVIVIGAPKLRLEIASQFGVDQTIDITTHSPAERRAAVLAVTQNRGCDVCVECTGVAAAVKEGFEMTRDGGTYVIVGHYTNVGDIPLNPHTHINAKHLNVLGCWGSDFSHFHLAVRFMAKFHDKYPFEKIVSREYSLDEAEEALNDVESLRVMKAIIAPN